MQALNARLANAENYRRSAAATGAAMTEIAEWELFFSVNGTALNRLVAARQALLDAGDPANATAIFAPDTPTLLAAHTHAARVSVPADGFDGYVDAAIELTRYGHVRGVDIVAGAPWRNRRLERVIRVKIGRLQYRPRFIDGTLARRDRFVARFYYAL